MVHQQRRPTAMSTPTPQKTRIQKAQETRKRKRDDELALTGFKTYINSATDKDRTYIIRCMDDKPQLVDKIARMLRDGTLEEAIEKAAAEETKPATDLGKALGKQTKHFKKLGPVFLQQFLEFLEKHGPKQVEAGSFKVVAKNTEGETVGPTQVQEILTFLLDVEGKLRLPSAHRHSDYTTPLLKVLCRRYVDCGARLQHFAGRLKNGAELGFFTWSLESAPSQVRYNLSPETVIRLPIDTAEFKPENEWRLVSNFSRDASLVSDALGRNFKLFDWLKRQNPNVDLSGLLKVAPFEYPDEVEGSDGESDDDDAKTSSVGSVIVTPHKRPGQGAARSPIPVADAEVLAQLQA